MSRIRPELRLYSASVDARAAEPDDLRAFRATVARKTHTTRDGHEWVFYDAGPHGQPPLVLLHGTSGTAAALFRQVTALSAHGVRAISVQYGCRRTHEEWASAFDRFLDGGSSRRRTSRTDCSPQTIDQSTLPHSIRDQLWEAYPDADRALLKPGGNFPFLAQAGEVSAHLLVFLRKQGVELAPST